jgi:adenylate kinase family enzyme
VNLIWLGKPNTITIFRIYHKKSARIKKYKHLTLSRLVREDDFYLSRLILSYDD